MMTESLWHPVTSPVPAKQQVFTCCQKTCLLSTVKVPTSKLQQEDLYLVPVFHFLRIQKGIEGPNLRVSFLWKDDKVSQRENNFSVHPGT